ncbi:MAG: hypothetical protein LM564_02035 [Desulfurococcaceae archaeon]|nr:hypothetical protein [Desulfurococcaceae archaeon]
MVRLVRSNPSTFTRDWALRWVRGSVESYLLGRTSLEVVEGRVRRAVESYGVSPGDVEAIVSSLLVDPLVGIPRELREEKARPILDFVKQLEGGGSG